MKFFGTKAVANRDPGDARPVLARAWGTGAVALGEWPASYEAQLRNGVIGNPVAQQAMRLVSEGAGAVTLRAAGSDAAARALALVTRASAGQALVETLAAHLLLHGNAYVQLIAGADGMPAELFALRPERVSVEADVRGWPAAYLYRVGDSVTRLSPEDGAGRTSVLHLKSLHPLGTIMGWAVSARRRARWRSTMARRCGTRRCWTMRRGRRVRWSMIPATDRSCRLTSMSG